MTTRDFEMGVMPSVVPGRIAFGVVGRGVYVYDWENPTPAFYASLMEGRGDPDLSPDGRLVGYVNARDIGEVREVDSGRLVATLGVLRGNHPIRMRNDAVVFQNYEGVFEQRLEDGAQRRLGEYDAKGIAYLTPSGYVSNEANLLAHLPLLNASDAGWFVVGSPSPTGLGVIWGGVYHRLDPEVNWLDCKATERAFATWSPERRVCRLLWNIESMGDIVKAFTVQKPQPAPEPPAPQPPTPTPTPEPSMTPNHRRVIEEVARQLPHLLVTNTRETCGVFVEHAVVALAAVDPNWGHVSKRQGEEQWNGHATDACKYKTNGQVVDFLGMAGAADLPHDHPDFGKPAVVGWDHKPSREGNDWMEPIPVAPPSVPNPGTPPPAIPGITLAELQEDLADLMQAVIFLTETVTTHETTIGELRKSIETLEQRPAAVGVQPGHPVQVSGKLSFGQALRGEVVTWTGEVVRPKEQK